MVTIALSPRHAAQEATDNSSSSEEEHVSETLSSCDTGTSSDLDSSASGSSERSLDGPDGSVGAKASKTILGMKSEGFEKAMQVISVISAKLSGACARCRRHRLRRTNNLYSSLKEYGLVESKAEKTTANLVMPRKEAACGMGSARTRAIKFLRLFAEHSTSS